MLTTRWTYRFDNFTRENWWIGRGAMRNVRRIKIDNRQNPPESHSLDVVTIFIDIQTIITIFSIFFLIYILLHPLWRQKKKLKIVFSHQFLSLISPSCRLSICGIVRHFWWFLGSSGGEERCRWLISCWKSFPYVDHNIVYSCIDELIHVANWPIFIKLSQIKKATLRVDYLFYNFIGPRRT